MGKRILDATVVEAPYHCGSSTWNMGRADAQFAAGGYHVKRDEKGIMD